MEARDESSKHEQTTTTKTKTPRRKTNAKTRTLATPAVSQK
jgi:hypothetical protein